MQTHSHDEIAQGRKKLPHKPKRVTNPLQAGIMTFLAEQPQTVSSELADVPKRYTRYGSLLLLGPTFSTHSTVWTTIFGSLTENHREELFRQIVKAFKDDTLTHVAVNAPISATKINAIGIEENVVRSPTGLCPMFGDFGPDASECDAQCPGSDDIDTAYWTQTTQLNGIVQVWAPRWTMFSRGNISEKARILQDGLSKSPFPGLKRAELDQDLEKIDVVDFYVGIGYFAFCYLARGVARVWGWEINGWSVEGLRRGCIENGWGVRVLKITDDGNVADGQTFSNLVAEIDRLQDTASAVRCIVFWGDNKWASKILAEVATLMETHAGHCELNIRHCNLGLLPSSAASWKNAVQTLNPSIGGWLHVHENTDMSGIDAKRIEIERRLQEIADVQDRTSWLAKCDYVEQVKTYAPGVVHAVYDIRLYPSR